MYPENVNCLNAIRVLHLLNEMLTTHQVIVMSSLCSYFSSTSMSLLRNYSQTGLNLRWEFETIFCHVSIAANCEAMLRYQVSIVRIAMIFCTNLGSEGPPYITHFVPFCRFPMQRDFEVTH